MPYFCPQSNPNCEETFTIHPQWLRSFGHHVTLGNQNDLHPGSAKKLIAVSILLLFGCSAIKCPFPTDQRQIGERKENPLENQLAVDHVLAYLVSAFMCWSPHTVPMTLRVTDFSIHKWSPCSLWRKKTLLYSHWSCVTNTGSRTQRQ